MTKKKIVSLTLSQKRCLIKEIENGVKKKNIAMHFGISPSSISSILKNKEKILEAATKKQFCHRKRIKKCVYSDVDKAVLEWLQEMKSKNIAVLGTMVQEKALKFAEKLGRSKFRASAGWLHKFKQRHLHVAAVLSGEFSTSDKRFNKSIPEDNFDKVTIQQAFTQNYNAQIDIDESYNEVDIFECNPVDIKDELQQINDQNELDCLPKHLIKQEYIDNEITCEDYKMETSIPLIPESLIKTEIDEDCLSEFKKPYTGINFNENNHMKSDIPNCSQVENALQTIKEAIRSRNNVPFEILQYFSVINQFLKSS